MKTLPRLVLFTAGLLALSALPAFAQGVKTGSPAPSFSLPGSDGKTYSLADCKGKVVVLEWFNHQCPIDSIQYQANNLQNLQKQYTGKGVVWFSVLSSAPGKQGYTDAAGANSQLTEYNASPTAVLLDPTGKVGHLYAAKTTPHLFIIGPNGVIVYQGAIDSQLPSSVADVAASDPWFKNALDATLAGQPVAKGTTKPYGCSIKYAD
jgi:peroxiredoxin